MELQSKLFTRPEAAMMLKVSIATVDRLIKEGKLAKTNITEGRILITLDAINALINQLVNGQQN